MAEASVVEFESTYKLFDGTDYAHHRSVALKRIEEGQQLVTSLQV